MADETPPTTPAAHVEPPPATPPAPAPTPPTDEPLGDGGKKALEAERKRAADAEKALKAAQKQLEELQAQNMTEQEKAIAAARAEGESEAMKRANERILRTEVKLAATGKLADPADALAHLDLASFAVDDDGSVDTKAITSAIEELVKAKPYLAGATPSTPGVPKGARGGSELPQLTRADLRTMSPDEITQAKAKGQLRDLLGVTT